MSGIVARFRLSRGTFQLDVDFTGPPKGFTILFGPSGAGKTSLLRAVAGLDPAATAHLEVNGEIWHDTARGIVLPPHRRPLGYVFQHSVLFPHLTVRQNLEYGFRRIRPAGRKIGFDAVVDSLRLGPLLDRRPGNLSGGERQRVAMGRALLASPELLLFDEPLASVDVASRRDILGHLEHLDREWGVPALYVSHSLEEVTRLAAHVVLLDGGSQVAAGPPEQVFSDIHLPQVHTRDAGAVIRASVESHDDEFELTRLDSPFGPIWIHRLPHPPATPVRIHVLARDVSLTLEPPSQSSVLNILRVQVEEVEMEDAAHVLVRLSAGTDSFFSRITRKSASALNIRPGIAVYAMVKSVALE